MISSQPPLVFQRNSPDGVSLKPGIMLSAAFCQNKSQLASIISDPNLNLRLRR
ncbi:hypothetical protein [Allorhizocola rhizosphaerae]|uniref:hypothetical protein n=1 Tax=Allorhizocola rhizosphaerae TaxID=1872709 RepID=UPI0013C34285|nr:hypothetical protein [Allorhizocola rhizosphaerae]